MSFAKRLFKVIPANQYGRCVVIVMTMFTGALMDSIGVGAILPLISAMGNPNYLLEHNGIANLASDFGIITHQQFIVVISICLIVIYLLKNLYLTWVIKLQLNFALENQKAYAVALMERYINKPYLYHVEHNSAYFMRNISNGPIITFSRMFTSVFLILSEICTVLGIWVIIAVADIITAFIVLFMFILIAMFMSKGFKDRISQQGKIQNKYMVEYMKWIQQGFGAIKDIKVMHKQSFFLKKFLSAYSRYVSADKIYGFVSQLPRMVIESVSVSFLLLFVIIKIISGTNPMDIVSLLGVLAVASFRLMPSANRILASVSTIKYHLANFDDIYDELVSIKDSLYFENNKDNEKTKEILEFYKSIEVRGVRFHYQGTQKDVLEDVTFSIPRGTFVGIIGESGAGKTTFVDILLGLMPPTNGGIYVDGKNIQDRMILWQNLIAYVPQSIYLIDGSILENIALGTDANDINEAEVVRVLKMAQLYEFVSELPEGLDTRVGERGVMLSGGQRQRIGIARALYQKPEILILDEATSALDNETEQSITETILNLKGQLTIIAIAHRLSTLAECDFKVKFDEGHVVILH